jgi:protoheme IX farnesyltransferase
MMRDYLELCKPRISLLVVIMTLFGYALAGGTRGPIILWTLLGAGLASCACGALNQWLEKEQDALMRRTAGRPLPSERLRPRQALAFGLCAAAAGLLVLFLGSLRPCFWLTAFTLAAYILLYTPLKRLTPQATWIGAAAGATPPLIGWAAAGGGLDARAWTLFAIMFLWQIPHFLAMFWIHREDYARAGFKVMPVVDPRGRSTAAQIALHSFSLLPATLAPSFCGLATPAYGVGALLVGTAYLGLGMKASWGLSLIDTRRLFLASLAYLPLVFGMLYLGGV